MSQNEFREQFIAWAQARGMISLDCESTFGMENDDRFISPNTSLAWSGWKAGIEAAQAVAPGGGEVPREALEKLFRAFVRAGGVMTVARHGVDIDQDEFYRDVQHGVMEIERYLHPERFDEFPTGTAPGYGALARTKADQKWGEWSAVLRRLIGDRTEKLHFAAEVQAVGDGVRIDNCRFINKEPVGYISFGEYRESCDVTDDQRATWQPVWTSKPDALLAAAPASEAKGRGQDDLCCPACEVTGFTMPIQHTEEMSFGRVIGLEADYCTNCGEAFVLPEKALRNEVKFNHARKHKPAASSAEESEGEKRARKLYEPDEYEDAFKGREQEQAGELHLTAEQCAQWLDAKYARHGEDEDRQAATLLRRAARVGVTDAMVARAHAAESKLALAEQDARRYRWLRKNATSGTIFSGGLPGGSLTCDEPESEWDATLDAAIAAVEVES